MLCWIFANLCQWIMNAMVKTKRPRANAVASLWHCVTFGGAGGYLVSASIWCSSQVSIQGGVRGEAHATTRCCKPPYNLCTPARAGTWNILSGASVTPVLKTLLKIELNWSPEKEDWSHICHWHASHLSATSLFCLHSSAAYRHLSKTLCVIKWYKIKRAITDLAFLTVGYNFS